MFLRHYAELKFLDSENADLNKKLKSLDPIILPKCRNLFRIKKLKLPRTSEIKKLKPRKKHKTYNELRNLNIHVRLNF